MGACRAFCPDSGWGVVAETSAAIDDVRITLDCWKSWASNQQLAMLALYVEGIGNIGREELALWTAASRSFRQPRNVEE
jgi:hypothetical protein